MHGTIPRPDRTVIGIGFAFLGFAILSSADALTKLLSSHYSIFEIASIDAVFASLIVIPVVVRAEGFASLRPRRPGLVLLRCALAAGSLIFCFVAFSKIPLADGYAIAFIAPLAVTALSVPLLGERVGWRQWIAVMVGFAAVTIILRPDVGAAGFGQFCMLASALLFALSLLVLRLIAASEPTGALMIAYLGMVFAMGLPMALAEWRTPMLRDFALLFVMGLCTGLGNVVLIKAARAAPAAIVSSFMYTQLVWGGVLGLLLFGDLPDSITLIGSAVIIACGLYTLWHASRQARIEATAQ
jgi:drug/metabolite transporter (DMT)-like permease